MIQKSGNTPLVIVSVSYALLSEVDAITSNQNDEVEIVFNGDNSWKEFYGTFESIEFAEPEENTPAGSLFNQQLKLICPGDDPLIRKQIFALNQRELIVKFEYSNLTSKILGEIQRPVFLTSGFQSKSFETFREILFSTQSYQPAKFCSFSEYVRLSNFSAIADNYEVDVEVTVYNLTANAINTIVYFRFQSDFEQSDYIPVSVSIPDSESIARYSYSADTGLILASVYDSKKNKIDESYVTIVPIIP